MLQSEQFPYCEIVIAVGVWSIVDFAYLDTGFEGGLIVPAYIRDEIPARSVVMPLAVANGQVVYAPSWNGFVELEDTRFPVEISAMGPRFLLGRDVLDKLSVCFKYGRQVSIEF